MSNVIRMKSPDLEKKERRREQTRIAQRNFKDQMRREGFKQFTVWLSAENQQLLTHYCKETGASRDEAMNDMIDLAQAEIERLRPKLQ